MSNHSDTNTSVALAGGAITAELLGVLHERGVLSLDDSRLILDRAMKALAPVATTGNGHAAQMIIADMLKTKYPARS